MATIAERETQQIDHANSSRRAPVVFIHGLWLLPSSWDRGPPSSTRRDFCT